MQSTLSNSHTPFSCRPCLACLCCHPPLPSSACSVLSFWARAATLLLLGGVLSAVNEIKCNVRGHKKLAHNNNTYNRHTHTRTHWHAVEELCKVVLVNLMNFRHLSSTELSRAGGCLGNCLGRGEGGIVLLSLCLASNEVLRNDFAHDWAVLSNFSILHNSLISQASYFSVYVRYRQIFISINLQANKATTRLWSTHKNDSLNNLYMYLSD